MFAIRRGRSLRVPLVTSAQLASGSCLRKVSSLNLFEYDDNILSKLEQARSFSSQADLPFGPVHTYHEVLDHAHGELEWLDIPYRKKRLRQKRVKLLWSQLIVHQENPGRCFQILRTLYYHGDPKAEMQLANAFVTGEYGLPINLPCALALFRSAAEKGSRHAEIAAKSLNHQIGTAVINEEALHETPEQADKRLLLIERYFYKGY